MTANFRLWFLVNITKRKRLIYRYLHFTALLSNDYKTVTKSFCVVLTKMSQLVRLTLPKKNGIIQNIKAKPPWYAALCCSKTETNQGPTAALAEGYIDNRLRKCNALLGTVRLLFSAGFPRSLDAVRKLLPVPASAGLPGRLPGRHE